MDRLDHRYTAAGQTAPPTHSQGPRDTSPPLQTLCLPPGGLSTHGLHPLSTHWQETWGERGSPKVSPDCLPHAWPHGDSTPHKQGARWTRPLRSPWCPGNLSKAGRPGLASAGLLGGEAGERPVSAAEGLCPQPDTTVGGQSQCARQGPGRCVAPFVQNNGCPWGAAPSTKWRKGKRPLRPGRQGADNLNGPSGGKVRGHALRCSLSQHPHPWSRQHPPLPRQHGNPHSPDPRPGSSVLPQAAQSPCPAHPPGVAAFFCLSSARRQALEEQGFRGSFVTLDEPQHLESYAWPSTVFD